jgi:hypothetical protein
VGHLSSQVTPVENGGTVMKKDKISFKVSPKVANAIKQMASGRRKVRVVRVVGQVKKGVVEIDYDGLSKVAKKFPKARIAFVALNAPFKTKAPAESL